MEVIHDNFFSSVLLVPLAVSIHRQQIYTYIYSFLYRQIHILIPWFSFSGNLTAREQVLAGPADTSDFSLIPFANASCPFPPPSTLTMNLTYPAVNGPYKANVNIRTLRPWLLRWTSEGNKGTDRNKLHTEDILCIYVPKMDIFAKSW